MYKICILLDKFYKFGGGEIFLEDLIINGISQISFKYLFYLKKPENVYQNPSSLPLEVLDFNKKNIDLASKDCDFLIFWGRVLDAPKHFEIKNKLMWAHSDFNVNYFLEKSEDYATHYIACSESVKNAINKKKCTVIQPGIDQERYKKCDLSKTQIKKILGFDEEDFIIGQFCRFEKFKNIPFLINAISKIQDKNVKILLVGHGEELNSTIKLCESKIPKRFQHVYYTNTSNISNFYKCIDAFCLPSLGEGFARVQWESAMFGVPFMGTEVGGVKEGIIHDFNGFIIKNETDIELIIKKLKNNNFNEKIISNSYDFFSKEGDIKNSINKLLKLCDSLNDRKKFYI